MRARGRQNKCVVTLLAGCAVALLGADSGPRFSSELRVTGMTFVGSRGSANELVLRAKRADFHPETNLAVLSDVYASALDAREKRSFDVRCDTGELDVETNDFLAKGDVHGTTGEPPLQRFERAEAGALRPLPAKAPFLQVRELTRRVHTDACIELDTNRYSVPWRLIGETVTVIVSERQVRALYAGQEVACHAQSMLRRVSVIERSHLVGIVGAQFAGMSWLPRTPAPPPAIAAELLRPLEQYEAALGGGW